MSRIFIIIVHLRLLRSPFCHIAQKMKIFIKDFFSKCDQIRIFLRIWSHLVKKSLIKNFIFCAESANMKQNNVSDQIRFLTKFPLWVIPDSVNIKKSNIKFLAKFFKKIILPHCASGPDFMLISYLYLEL